MDAAAVRPVIPAQSSISEHAGSLPPKGIGQDSSLHALHTSSAQEHVGKHLFPRKATLCEEMNADQEARFHIISFNSTLEACANFLGKGPLVAIQGRVQTRECEDREGTNHEVMQVVAEKVTFLGAAKREEPPF